jgi:hypothetical protein
MIRSAAAFVMVISLLAARVEAEPAQPVMTAADLQQLCVASDTTSKNVCRVYILGVTQGIGIGLNIADGKSAVNRPCIPQRLSGESLAESVKAKLGQTLTASPQDQGMDAADFVAGVMARTFSCRKAP